MGPGQGPAGALGQVADPGRHHHHVRRPMGQGQAEIIPQATDMAQGGRNKWPEQVA